ncbi:MarR family winged helix-turn-helix transcriptional regulator [Povalibacter uvarum]|nr:MarR family transcriptional regulator [Povalibacter uvarum]
MSQRNAKIRGLSLGDLPPERAVPYLLRSLGHVLRQALEESLRRERIDMSFTHLSVLYTLESEPGIAGAEIARRCFVTAQTMNTILRRLESDGDVKREPHPGNSRADSWHLSDEGQRRLQRAKGVGDAVWARLLSALKASETDQLQSLLRKCIQGFDVAVTEGAAATASGRRGAARKAATAKRSRR